jgi:hypothetical protein
MGSFKDLAKLKGLAAAGLTVKTAREQQVALRDDELARQRALEEATAGAVLANAPRYPWARAATLAEARALLGEHALAFSLAGRGEVEAIIDAESLVGPAQIADGALSIDELLLPRGGSSLYVRGDLTVARRIVQRSGAGSLVVFGALRAHHVITTGQILVTGDLDVTGTLYGNSPSHATIVLGAARIATLIAARRHLFSLLGSTAIGALVDPDRDAPNFSIFARTAPRSTRAIDPAIGDPHDEAAIAAALTTADHVLTPS